MTTPTPASPARPRKEPTKVVRLPQSVCDRILPLLADIGTDAVLALLSQNPHPLQSPLIKLTLIFASLGVNRTRASNGHIVSD